MRRIQLFEFMDQSWYPPEFRRLQADYLQFAVTLSDGHERLLPVLQRAMRHAGTTEVVDLCSGATGPWTRLVEALRRTVPEVRLTLTDKFPDPSSLERWPDEARRGVEYLGSSVDATDVPPRLSGLRTIFEGFHHFTPEQARAILKDAFDRRAAIGVFEVSVRSPLLGLSLLLAPIATPLICFLCAPFIRPRTLSRFLWTYLLPLVPLAMCWDGAISLLRVYSVAELLALTAPLQRDDYVWEAGRVSSGAPLLEFTYLVGHPRSTEPSH